MVGSVLNKKLFRELYFRKGALIALLLIMAVGISVFTSMASMYRDLFQARANYYRDYQLADFTLDLKRAPLSSVRQGEQTDNVLELYGRIKLSVRLDLPECEEPILGSAISLPPDPQPILNNLLLQSGTWFSGPDQKEVILNHAFAGENGIKPGQRIKVLLLDQEHDLLVVGTAMSPEFIYLIPPGAGMAPDPARFGVIYLPERFLRRSGDLQGACNQVLGLAHDKSRAAINNTLTLLKEKLDPYGVTLATPVQDQTSARFLADELEGLKITATVMPAIFLMVGALVLNLLMNRMIVQERVVIGTLRALGHSKAAMIRHYLCFSVFVGISGGLCGIILGAWLHEAMAGMYRQFYAMPGIITHTYGDLIFTGLAVSVLFSLLGALKAVISAASLTPAEAMRPPPPERGNRIFLEKLSFFWAPLSFRWKMILRAIFRNPFRSSVTMFASMAATALILAAISMLDSMNLMMRYQFEQVTRQDITLSMRDPQNITALPEFSRFRDVFFAEGELVVTCQLTNGPHKKRVGVIGLPRFNRLHTPLDQNQAPIVTPEQGLVLHEKLAEILDVKPGDRVRLRPLIARREETSALVAATVKGFLGISAYSSIPYLSRLLGETYSVNVLNGLVAGQAPQEPFLEQMRDHPELIGLSRRTRSLEQLDASFGQTMGAMLGVTILFAGLMAFGSVLNSALVSLNERRREASTLRVLGYSPTQVSRLFSRETLLLNLVGVGLGLGTGIGLIHLLSKAYDTELYRFPVVIYPSRLLISGLVMAVFVCLAQWIIHGLIKKMNWLDVLQVKE